MGAWLIDPGWAKKGIQGGSEERVLNVEDEKRRIAEALRGGTISERERLAAFVRDPATAFAANPFPSTTAGAARQRWSLREIEFEAMGVASAGLTCLMASLGGLPIGEPLRQEILRSAAHVLYLLRHGDGGPIIGAVLHGKPGNALPPFVLCKPAVAPRPATRRPSTKRSSCKWVASGQLDLFATG